MKFTHLTLFTLFTLGVAAPIEDAYKTVLDIVSKNQAKSFALNKRSVDDSHIVIFNDGVDIAAVKEQLQSLDSVMSHSSNVIHGAFNMDAKTDGSGFLGYVGSFNQTVLDYLEAEDGIMVIKDSMVSLPGGVCPGSNGDNGSGDNFDNFDNYGNEDYYDGEGDDYYEDCPDSPGPDVPAPENPSPDTGNAPPSRAPPYQAPSSRAPPSRAPPQAPPAQAPPSGAGGNGGSTSSPTNQWGLGRISHRQRQNGQQTYVHAPLAKDTVVYVIDSGIRITHQMFGGRAVWGANFADNENLDLNGHGTHVAGTVGGQGYGVAPNTRLVAVKVWSQMHAPLSQIMDGVSWTINDYVRNRSRMPRGVINFSGGTDDHSGATSRLFERAVQEGMVVAVAAGNNDRDASTTTPGADGPRVNGLINVGAIDQYDRRSIWGYTRDLPGSNYGPSVEVWAPGTDITSAGFRDDYSTSTMYGTSMACPHVAGLAAYFLSTTGETNPGRIEQMIKGNPGMLNDRDLRGGANYIAYNGAA